MSNEQILTSIRLAIIDEIDQPGYQRLKGYVESNAIFNEAGYTTTQADGALTSAVLACRGRSVIEAMGLSAWNPYEPLQNVAAFNAYLVEHYGASLTTAIFGLTPDERKLSASRVLPAELMEHPHLSGRATVPTTVTFIFGIEQYLEDAGL